MRSVLVAYTKRNPTVGYSQGMNFVVSRLLQVLPSEEQAFWVFSMIVESMLPLDYYCNLVGVLIDQKIFYEIFQKRIPDLCDYLIKMGLDPSLLAFQWFVCLFSYNLP